jgi:hypothetical protein
MIVLLNQIVCRRNARRSEFLQANSVAHAQFGCFRVRYDDKDA